MMALLERAARDPAVDIDKMERLFGLKAQAETRQAEAEFNTAMAAAQAELIPVAKNAPNPQTRSRYATISAIAEAAMPIVHKYGFGVSFSEVKSEVEGCIGLGCKVSHAGGHSERFVFHVPIDGGGLRGNSNKTAVQAYGSTITYGRRYALCMAFNIATKDDLDGNRETPEARRETITAEQVSELEALLRETSSDLGKFLALGKLASLADMPAGQFESARGMILKKKQKASGQ